MKQMQIIGMLLICVTYLKAQNIPSNFVAKVSYDVEITTFKQIPVTADVSQLTDFEKLSFKPVIQRQHEDHYLSANNNITTVIYYGPTTYGDQTYDEDMKTLVIDPTGLYGYDRNNQLILSEGRSPLAQQHDEALKEGVTKNNFMLVAPFTLPSSSDISEAQSKGYLVTTTSRSYNIKGNNEEFLHDADRKLKERKVFSNGQLSSSSKQFYTQNNRGENVPSVNVETRYEPSQAGLLVEVVTVEKTTNYSRITN